MRCLELEGVSVSFGGVRALTGARLRVDAGSVVGLIGPNGAGKTTLVDAVTGFVRSTGRIACAGSDLGGLRPDQRVRAGVARTWQAAELFDDLSVGDNVLAGAERGGWKAVLRDLAGRRDREAARRAGEALERVGLVGRATAPVHRLTHGERKLVGVARALATGPRVLLLDEPAAGLDRTEAAELGAGIRALAQEGMAVLVIDHDMGLVLGHCDRVYVLEFGSIIAQGTASEVQADERVVAAYLGSGRAPREREVLA